MCSINSLWKRKGNGQHGVISRKIMKSPEILLLKESNFSSDGYVFLKFPHLMNESQRNTSLGGGNEQWRITKEAMQHSPGAVTVTGLWGTNAWQMYTRMTMWQPARCQPLECLWREPRKEPLSLCTGHKCPPRGCFFAKAHRSWYRT